MKGRTSGGGCGGIKFFQKYKESSMIKEALDNLPSGVCYFDERGVPTLVNKTMYELMQDITGRDIQDISDFDGIQFSDATACKGEVWQFQKRRVGTGTVYTEIIASNITELHQKRCELERSTIEEQNLMRRLEEISRNVVSITRNEEILAMKMHIHNEFGIALAETRQFINSDFAPKRKAEYIENHRRVAKKLLGEIGNDDEIDVFSELKANTKKLGAEIVFEGELPKPLEGLMTQSIRGCLINTIKHGKGDKVFVKLVRDERFFTATITGNGEPPASKIVEGGGLGAIRKNVEAMGGTMVVEWKPEVAVKIIFPLYSGKDLQGKRL